MNKTHTTCKNLITHGCLHTHMNTHKNMLAYTHAQTLIHTGIHTNICTRTCMHTHTLTYTPTNHETSQIFTNTHTDARACARTHTHTQAHTYASCAWIAMGSTSFSSADDPMTRCRALGLKGEMATPMRQGVWCLLPVVLNAVPIHSQCSDHYLRNEASWL